MKKSSSTIFIMKCFGGLSQRLGLALRWLCGFSPCGTRNVHATNPPPIDKSVAPAPASNTVPAADRKKITSLSALKDLPKERYLEASQVVQHEKASFYFKDNGLLYDFLFARSTSNEPRLFVHFSGNINRGKITPPAFHRWTWANKFPGHCLYFSDPSLYLSDSIGLAWYTGTSEIDAMPAIGRVVCEIAGELGIPSGNLYAYGSSGGGFAGLRLATMVPELVPIAINPQTDILRYDKWSVSRYLRLCHNGKSRSAAADACGERLSLLPHLGLYRGQRLIYVQNRLDIHHYENHYAPFVRGLGLEFGREYRSRDASIILFDHPGGHGKAETPDVFNEIMKLVIHGAESGAYSSS